MFLIAILAIVMVVVSGLIITFMLSYQQTTDYYGNLRLITRIEFVVVALIMSILVTPGVLFVGKKLSVANIVTYEQWLNGVETKAVDDVVTCRAGHSGLDESAGKSNCKHVYKSGSYPWTEYYLDQDCTTDSKGNRSCTPVTKSRTRWADIFTPYATVEHRYSIQSSFGFKENDDFHFDGVYLDAEPEPYGKKAIPSSIPRGAPQDWAEADARLRAGDPRAVTALDTYPNYILASDDEVLKTYSVNIDRFKEQGILPAHTAGIMDDPVTGPSDSQARKLSFVGVDVPDEQLWQDSLMRFNSALGMELQGDLHVVIVDAGLVGSDMAVDYINALKAYWQGPAFGKRALAKNGIVLAIGVTGSEIEWAESTTGMPFGNEAMAQYIRDYLPDAALSPEAVFGIPKTVIDGDKATVTLSPVRGVLERIMFEDAPFERASMSCEEEGCVGYKDLLDTIDPTPWQKFFMLLVTMLIALVLWFGVGSTSVIDEFFVSSSYRPGEREYPYDPYHDRGRGKNRKKKR